MRHYGTIIRWNDNRRFGAIREENMGKEIFAPLSAFTTLPHPPAEGQRVSFEIIKGRRGRDEAENICFASDCIGETDFFAPEPEPFKAAFSKLLWIIPVIALLAAGGWFGWNYWQEYRRQVQETTAAAPVTMDGVRSCRKDESRTQGMERRGKRAYCFQTRFNCFNRLRRRHRHYHCIQMRRSSALFSNEFFGRGGIFYQKLPKHQNGR